MMCRDERDQAHDCYARGIGRRARRHVPCRQLDRTPVVGRQIADWLISCPSRRPCWAPSRPQGAGLPPVSLEKDYTANSPDERWESYYARRAFERTHRLTPAGVALCSQGQPKARSTRARYPAPPAIRTTVRPRRRALVPPQQQPGFRVLGPPQLVGQGRRV